MKIVKDYFLSVCVVYTIGALVKSFLEGITGKYDNNYAANYGMMFVIICFATFVLYMHRIFHKVPLLFVIIGQYVMVQGGVWFGMFLASKYMEISVHAYRDMFFQITFPYIVFASIYYVTYFQEVKKANRNLLELKKKVEKESV